MAEKRSLTTRKRNNQDSRAASRAGAFHSNLKARQILTLALQKVFASPTWSTNPGGMAKKLSAAAVILKLEQAWSIGASDTEAAMCAGISPTRVSQLKNEMPELAEYAEALKQRPVFKARSTIVKNLRKPRWSAWYLERKVPAEFAQQQKVEHSGEMLFSHFAGKQSAYEKPGIIDGKADTKP